MLKGLSCIFPSDDIKKTADYYEQKLGFRQEQYLNAAEPHICLFRDSAEIILTQTNGSMFLPNHLRYGYGYDAYIYTEQQEELHREFKNLGVKIVKALSRTDYNNREFVVEDIDGRWIAFGTKE